MDDLILLALQEDRADCDLTTLAVIGPDKRGLATITAKASGVVSGVVIARQVFAQIDATIDQQWFVADGQQVAIGQRLCELTGPIRALLAGERTALNFLQHLSGIATATHHFVAAVAGTGCLIADTRKTTPGLRQLEKAAVKHGGGINHRLDLESALLLKENHIAAAGSIAAAVAACRKLANGRWIEVECETLAQVAEAVAEEPTMILLDNMSVAQVAEARKIVPDSIILEASGGITLANARAYAETNVNRLAIGAITHSAPALDLSMRLQSATQSTTQSATHC